MAILYCLGAFEHGLRHPNKEKFFPSNPLALVITSENSSMTQGLARFHARSPRYFLNTEDESLIRVAGPNKIPWEEDTEIKNVSLTGLSFTAPEDLCPVLGEVIKIQFVVPGSQQMASCHSNAIRTNKKK